MEDVRGKMETFSLFFAPLLRGTKQSPKKDCFVPRNDDYLFILATTSITIKDRLH